MRSRASAALWFLHVLILTTSCLVSSWVVPPTLSLSRLTSTHLNAQGKSKASQEKRDVMLNFIDEPMTNLVGDQLDNDTPPEDDDLADMVRTICKAADDRKAQDIVAMRVSKFSTLTSFLVICSGNSRPQNQAICASIQDAMTEEYDMRTQGSGVPEGTADSGWMLLDYGSVMVHVMTPKSRLFYDIQGQWTEKGGEYMNLDSVILPNSLQEEPSLGGGMGGVSEQDDPFWS